MAKSTVSNDPVREQDKFMLRLPEGMRERIKAAAEKSGRSMNGEIVAVLEHHFPPEPTVEEVLERVHDALSLANQPWGLPYRQVLIDALDEFSDRLSKGIEFEQMPDKTVPSLKPLSDFTERYRRWERAKKYGVEQSDLENEISKGFLRKFRGETIKMVLDYFAAGQRDKALHMLRLDHIKFADPEAAVSAIEKDLREYFDENWGDITDWDSPSDD